MARVEVCRITFGQDSKQEANQWFEARLVTDEGEVVIRKVEFWHEQHRSDRSYLLGYVLKFFFKSDREHSEDLKKSVELTNNAHAKLVAQLMQDGWDISATDDKGRATMMKRSVE